MAETKKPTAASLCWIEHEALEHIKGALRVTLDWQGPLVEAEHRRESLAFALQSFSRHLERLMQIEERGGYMTEVEEAKPCMADRVHDLSDDHDRFRQKLADFAPRLEAVTAWDDSEFYAICDEVRDFLEDVDAHDLAEVRLLQEALTLDEGGEG